MPASAVPVVLVTHASMNPIHLGHIDMLRRAKAELEGNHGYSVVKGIIAVTKLSHIRGKGAKPIPTAERLRLIELACAGLPWLSGCDGSRYSSSKRFLEGELPRLRQEMGDPRLEGADCQGSDTLMRWGSSADIAVVVCRTGDEQKLAAWVAAQDAAANGRRKVAPAALPPAPGSDLGAASSTAARAACEAGDAPLLASICGPAVAEELLRTALGGRPARLYRKKGADLLAAPEHFVVHQCNCTSVGARGLAMALFGRFPHADVYQQRHAAGQHSVVGSISLYGGGGGGGGGQGHQRGIINLHAQKNPGKARAGDSAEDRLRWFAASLRRAAAATATAAAAGASSTPPSLPRLRAEP
eukprot:SAG11_NODE_555_length_8566_cov_15.547774_1_plen_356_part_10